MIPSVAASFGAKPGVIPGAALSGGAALHEFTLTNTEGATTSTGLGTIGLAFETGDVSSSQVLQAKIGGSIIDTSIINMNTWESDGSLRYCTLVYDAGSFTSGQSKTVEVSAVAGSQGASTVNPVTFIAGLADDLTVEIRNHTGSSDNTDVGNIDFSLQTAAAVSSRRETQEDTPGLVRFFCWENVGNDQHLTCLHYVDLYLNAAGDDVVAYTWTPVLSQHWWVNDPLTVTVQTKQRRDYDAEAFQGATSLQAQTGLQHAYYCQWAMVRDEDDDQHACPFWFDEGTAMPTLIPSFTDASWFKMMKAGYVPPTDLAQTYTGFLYTNPGDGTSGGPGDDYNLLASSSSRTSIAATSGYIDRGILSDVATRAILEQTAQRWRQARVASFDGLAIYHHLKDHRNAVGGAFDGDAAMSMFPQEIDLLGAKTYTGLAAEDTFSEGSGSNNPDDPAVGGTGGFSSWNLEHHVSYSYFYAFISGYRFLFDSLLDQLNWIGIDQNFNGGGMNPVIMFAVSQNAERRDALSLDNTTQYGHTFHRVTTERELAWAELAWNNAYALIPDADRHHDVLTRGREAADDWLTASIAEFPASQDTLGTMYVRNLPVISAFMNSMAAQTFSKGNILRENADLGFVDAERRLVRYFRDALLFNGYILRHQTHLAYENSATGTVAIPATERYAEILCTSDGADPSTITTLGGAYIAGVLPAEDDPIFIDSPTSADPLPNDVNAGQKYFMVNVSNNSFDGTFQVSETVGGAAIQVQDTTTLNASNRIRFYMYIDDFKIANTAQLGANGTLIPDDDNSISIGHAACEYHYGKGGAEISTAQMTTIRNFMAPKTYSNLSNWNFDGDQIRTP